MRSLCFAIENGPHKDEKPVYINRFLDIKDWYVKQHSKYENLLKNDMLSELGEFTTEQARDWDSLAIKDYSDNASAKVNLFERAEHLCKLMLSVFSYGPDSSCPMKFYHTYPGKSWFDKDNFFKFFELIEILEMQLEKHHEGENLNLATFTEEKHLKNTQSHQGDVNVCVSIIRCYNILRDMLVFMEPDCSSQLPKFSYPREILCDTQLLLRKLKGLNFQDNENTMLVVGPLHDLPRDSLTVLANLPWTLVIDLDGYSEFGGLYSAVEHEHINPQKFEQSTTANFTIKRNITTWLTCGDFANYSYCQSDDEETLKKGRVRFDPQKKSFNTSFRQLPDNMESCIENIIKVFSAQLRPLNILYIHDFDDNSTLAASLVRFCDKYLYVKSIPYTMTSVYYDSLYNWENLKNQHMRRYMPGENDPVDNIISDLDSMANGLIEFKSELPLLDCHNVQEPFRLPSESGITGIGQNLAINLDEMFDVLYEDAGVVDNETANKELSSFYRGGCAAWSVLRNSNTVPLLDSSYEKHLSKIKDSLAFIPEPNSGATRIFTILHDPGIGGSTLLRQIGWDLHRDFPVLLVKRYDSKIKTLVRNLYDKQKRGILLLADDNLTDRERLIDDVNSLDRACALILTERYEKQRKDRKGIIIFTCIPESGEQKLRSQFKAHSLLLLSELDKKDEMYDEFVSPPGMRCPFMIGLYYLEKDFDGVAGYVQRLMARNMEKRELKILAMLGLCHIYGNIGLPQSFVNNYLNIPLTSSYLKNYPDVESVLIPAKEGLDEIDTYKPKHILLAREMLEQCCLKLYGNSAENCLTDLSKLLIDAIFTAYKNDMHYVYQDILEKIFITKEEERFSPLIMTIKTSSSRKDVLFYLAEKFNSLTVKLDPVDALGLYQMNSHQYGHLGRLCRNRQYGLDNPDAAIEYGEKSVSLMEACGNYDHSSIYHMYGLSLSAKLKKTLEEKDKWLKANGIRCPNQDEYHLFESKLDEIRTIFEKSADHADEHSECYALTALIDIYLFFLNKLSKWNLQTEAKSLSERERIYHNEIEHLLEWPYSRDLQEKDRESFQERENKYRSEFKSVNNDAIGYYEQRLKKLKATGGSDGEILNTQIALITALLKKHRMEAKEHCNEFVPLKSENLQKALYHLEDVLGGPADFTSYRERQLRISCYDRWFYLAKMPGAHRSIEKALDYSERWIDLNEQSHGTDPRPYYYYAVCSILYKLDKNSFDNDAKVRTCWDKCQKYSRSKGFNDRIRDAVIKGTGLEQLLDMRYSLRNPYEFIEAVQKEPMIVQGKFEDIKADKGFIRITEPPELCNYLVKFTREKGNSIGENQRTHKLACFIGFTYEGFRAIDQYVSDLDAKEPLPHLKEASQHEPQEQSIKSQISVREKQSQDVITISKDFHKQINEVVKEPQDTNNCNGQTEPPLEISSSAVSPLFKNGDRIEATLISITDNKYALGSFTASGQNCQVRISYKGKKDKDKLKSAKCPNNPLRIMITGYKDGLYSGRLL